MKKILYLTAILVFESCGASKIVYPCDVAVYGEPKLKNYENRYFVFHKEGHVYEAYFKNVYDIGRWEVHSDTLLLMNQYHCSVRNLNDSVVINKNSSTDWFISEIQKYLIKDDEIFLLDKPQFSFKQVFGLEDYFHKQTFTYENFVPFIK